MTIQNGDVTRSEEVELIVILKSTYAANINNTSALAIIGKRIVNGKGRLGWKNLYRLPLFRSHPNRGGPDNLFVWPFVIL